ncbi:hypothetical protein GCM10023314_02780 [Algibacter agarivorans]|uniref:DUF5017 domain-containing protein n=1 Tax=Algibacter agarivorans TaxID=1109741 RepID=A0ABP9GA21_9FLAO
MKNIKILQFMFIASLLLFSCNEDESVTLVEPNHRVIVTSEMNFENTINIGGHIDFGDLSRGVKSRVWTFPTNATNISGEDGNTSARDVIKGFFYEPGVYDVVLSQVFSGNVYPNEDSTEPIQGRELDTTIVVTVRGNVAANIQINYVNDDGSTGAPLNLSNNAENEIIASKYVRLTQGSTGEPTDFNWSLNGAKPEQVLIADDPDAETDVRYSKLGTWDLQFIASRTRPTDADTIYIKNFIKVNPSTEPVVLDRVFEKEAQTKIGLEFSREMDPATVNKNNFTVSIDTAGGATLNPEIASVTVDANEGNILVVELANEVMYNDDIVKISYTPGVLSTLDAVQATTITDAILTDFIKTNILESLNVDHSIETSDDSNWPYLWWGGQWGEYDLSVSFDRAHTGDKSLYIEFRPNGGMIIGHKDAGGADITFTVESGFKYEMGAWIYIEDLGNITGEANVRMYWTPGTNWGIGDNVTFAPTTTTGEWFYSSSVVQFAAAGEVGYMIRGINTNTERLKFYMDDLTLYKLTSRP